jgi:hypothetical protein
MSFRSASRRLKHTVGLTRQGQSAFARHVLETQLDAVALHNPSEDEKTEADVVFNDSMCCLDLHPHMLTGE